jgi:hypothetical protein
MTHYSHFDVLMASPTEPLPLKKRQHQMSMMRAALARLHNSTSPSRHDWMAVATAVDMMETLLDMGLVQDPDKALEDAMIALMQNNVNDIEFKIFNGIFEDYEYVMENLSARTMIAVHRATEKRIQGNLNKGQKRRVAA